MEKINVPHTQIAHDFAATTTALPRGRPRSSSNTLATSQPATGGTALLTSPRKCLVAPKSRAGRKSLCQQHPCLCKSRARQFTTSTSPRSSREARDCPLTRAGRLRLPTSRALSRSWFPQSCRHGAVSHSVLLSEGHHETRPPHPDDLHWTSFEYSSPKFFRRRWSVAPAHTSL